MTEQTKKKIEDCKCKYPLWRLAPTGSAVILAAFNLCPLLGEAKYRNSLPNSREKLLAWGKLNSMGKKIALPALFASIIFGGVAFRKTEQKMYLFGAIAAGLSIPYSLFVVGPTQKQLKKTHSHVQKGGYMTKADQQNVDKQMKQWDKWAKIRAVFSLAAVVMFVLAELNVASKDNVK